MKLRLNNTGLVLLSVIITGPLSLSCSDWFGPSISGLATSTGLTGGSQASDTSNSFYVDSPQVCCSARLSGAHRNTAITCKWVLVKGEMAAQDNPVVHEETAYTNTDCNVGFTLTPPAQGFISGEYKAELLIDGHTKAATVFYIQKEQAGSLPQIGTFKFNPAVITAGQQSELSWQVTGATRVTLKPSPGKVDAAGRIKVGPNSDITYTLYAVNRSGSSCNTISIKVMPLITDKADLEIIDFWNTGNILFYRIKNNGALASCPCFAALYKNDVQVSKDYIAPLTLQEERVESFASYHFSPRFSSFDGSSLDEGTTDAVNMRICLNQPQSCEEKSIDDNCMEHNFGFLLNVNLMRYAKSAEWANNSGAVKLPAGRDYKAGWVAVGNAHMVSGLFPNSLLMVPGTTPGKWLQGSFGIPQGSPVTLQPFTIPHKCKFTGKVGLTSDAPATASVQFTMGIKQGETIDYFTPIVVTGNTKLQDYEVDLSGLAGKQVQFVFRVEAGGTLMQGSAAWIDPVLYQER